MESTPTYGATAPKLPAISTATVSGDLVVYNDVVIGSIDCITHGPRCTTWAIELASEFGEHEEMVHYKKDAVRQLVRVYREAIAARAEQEAPKYDVVLIAAAPTAHAALVEALAAFQAEANGLLVAAGYPQATAQVSASILPQNGLGFNFMVSAVDPNTVLFTTLSFGMAPTPEAALDQFSARLVPALASQVRYADNPDAADHAADAAVAYAKEAA